MGRPAGGLKDLRADRRSSRQVRRRPGAASARATRTPKLRISQVATKGSFDAYMGPTLEPMDAR
jgi:hypothetical protein